MRLSRWSDGCNVKWDASAANVDGVHLYLDLPGEESKLWVTSGPVAQQMTGQWLRDGTVVRLVDGAGTGLAAVTVSDSPCN